ncbi:MAG: DUF624 domain-containing protein [bacterium]|nr:DUF624 domain-containing protein [bacterium]
MKSFFNPDGPLMQFITKIAYSAYLNLLWFLCCLPIVTVGASTTALFYVSLKIVKNEEGNITKAFFRSFRDNFKKGTVIWLILLGIGILLAADGYIFYHMRFENIFWTLGTAVFIVAVAAYAIILMYIFPLLSRFENTVKAMFLNSIMLGMRFLLCTVLMAAIYALMAYTVINLFMPAVIFGQGLCALLCSWLLSNILKLCEEKADAPSEEENGAEYTDSGDADTEEISDRI